jgi:nucleotide-binding universal stress UspA family protein
MFDRMLLVLDGPADWERAGPLLRPLAGVEGAHVIVVLTIPFLETLAEMPSELSPKDVGDDEAAEVFVDALVATLRAEGLAADGFTCVGRSALTLHATAERVEASLIVLPSRPSRRLEELLRFVRVPVIAVPPVVAPIQRILMPFDDTEESVEILPHAAALARAFRAEVSIVPTGPAYRQTLERRTLEQLSLAGVAADLVAGRGDPVAAVLALCRSLPAEAIAIGPGEKPWIPALAKLSPVPVLRLRHAANRAKRPAIEIPAPPRIVAPVVETWKRHVPLNPLQGITEL